MSDEERVRSALGYRIPNLTLVEGLTTDNLQDRRSLLAQFDKAGRIHDLRATCRRHQGAAAGVEAPILRRRKRRMGGLGVGLSPGERRQDVDRVARVQGLRLVVHRHPVA